MRLIAKKPCSFDGKKFFIGDEIPAECVANPKAQEKMGVIAIVGGDTESGQLPKIGAINIPIHAEEGDLILCVTNEELNVFTDILQIPVSKAEDKQKVSEMIQNIESEDLLIMLDALDRRKFVKDEAQERAKILSASFEEDTPEDGGNPEPDTEPGGDE